MKRFGVVLLALLVVMLLVGQADAWTSRTVTRGSNWGPGYGLGAAWGPSYIAPAVTYVSPPVTYVAPVTVPTTVTVPATVVVPSYGPAYAPPGTYWCPIGNHYWIQR